MGCGPIPPEPDAGCGNPGCRQNTLVACGPDGGLLESPCGAARCAYDAPVPQCVPAFALPCTPGDAPDDCLDGRLLTCPPEVGYRLTVACPPDRLCVDDSCREIARIICNPDSWAELCLEGVLYDCHPRERHVRATPDERCALP